MIIYLYTAVFVLLLTECNAGMFQLCGQNSINGRSEKRRSFKEYNVDDLNYVGDHVTFACVVSMLQSGFYIGRTNGSVPENLIEKLDISGRGLSLFFHGVGNFISLKDGFLFQFAREWFTASGNNICIVSYAYTTNPTVGLKIVPHLNKMVTTNRLEYVAKLARDLVLGVREKCVQSNRKSCLKSLSQVDVSGFSFGAHVAGRTCEFLYQKTGQRVRMLLALDPSKTIPFFGTKPTNTIKRGHASYVQVIHTSVFGIREPLGDVDIYVKYKGESFVDDLNDKHAMGAYFHVATATKRLYVIADEKDSGNGTLIFAHGNVRKPKPSECVVGVYGTLNPFIEEYNPKPSEEEDKRKEDNKGRKDSPKSTR
ncbi:uncharacterized protein LOC116348367 isoform X2 [Contarinia nasturtii]|uniref:uncharacterized protein LOC116348367 isoform X2 n=1 Tax=Contarinia nasturtii TaxID=265458 RepID=UPI0012D38700|nr:uncharacterized protein LOC116348367 isoform X2 [Contarinia nasturtii]